MEHLCSTVFSHSSQHSLRSFVHSTPKISVQGCPMLPPCQFPLRPLLSPLRLLRNQFVVAFRLSLPMLSCRLRRLLAVNCFCLAEICWLVALFKMRRSTVINLHRNVRTLRHVWHTSPATTKWRGQNNRHTNSLNTALQTHSTSQQTMVTKRERRYNR